MDQKYEVVPGFEPGSPESLTVAATATNTLSGFKIRLEDPSAPRKAENSV